jgi:hypothetical protein
MDELKDADATLELMEDFNKGEKMEVDNPEPSDSDDELLDAVHEAKIQRRNNLRNLLRFDRD